MLLSSLLLAACGSDGDAGGPTARQAATEGDAGGNQSAGDGASPAGGAGSGATSGVVGTAAGADGGSAGMSLDAGGRDGGAGGSSGGAGGSSGSAGGSSGSGGTGGTGATQALMDDDACTAASESYPARGWLDAVVACDGQGLDPSPDTGIVNPSGVTVVSEVVLDTPLPAGSPSALSMVLEYTGTAGTFELWGGTGDACGPASELLWWTEIASRRFCGEFTPSQEVTRLLGVWREQEVLRGQFDFGAYDVDVCASGSCPGDASGYGRVAGAALDAPVGFYELPIGGGLLFAAGGFLGIGVDGEGAIAFRTGDPPRQSGDPYPYPSGVVRMPQTDPFGDAWYCLGPGSQRVQNKNENDDEWTTLELRGLTRLASCEGGAGSESASIALGPTPANEGMAQVSASDSAFAMPDAQVRGGCRHTRCAFLFFADTETSAPVSTQLWLELDADVGTLSSPTLQDASVIAGSWIYSPEGTAPMQVACLSGGSVHYDPDAGTTLTLSGITATTTCPGQAVDPNSLDIRYE